jgi:hypothetical protein
MGIESVAKSGGVLREMETAESLRETTREQVRELPAELESRARKLAASAGRRARDFLDFYQDASEWVSRKVARNKGAALAIAGVLAAAGLLAYRSVRRKRSS